MELAGIGGRPARSRIREELPLLLRFCLCSAVSLFVACSDSAAPNDAQTSTPDVNIAACGAIGMACGSGCPNGFDCVDNACAPVRGDCGGFAGAECQDTSLVCTYPTGSSAGICMQAEEKACMCAIAPNALSDCTPP